MLILADHHQKLIYTRAHLLPLLALLPQETTTKKVIQLFFSNMRKVHKKTDVYLGLTKVSWLSLVEVT